ISRAIRLELCLVLHWLLSGPLPCKPQPPFFYPLRRWHGLNSDLHFLPRASPSAAPAPRACSPVGVAPPRSPGIKAWLRRGPSWLVWPLRPEGGLYRLSLGQFPRAPGYLPSHSPALSRLPPLRRVD